VHYLSHMMSPAASTRQQGLVGAHKLECVVRVGELHPPCHGRVIRLHSLKQPPFTTISGLRKCHTLKNAPLTATLGLRKRHTLNQLPLTTTSGQRKPQGPGMIAFGPLPGL